MKNYFLTLLASVLTAGIVGCSGEQSATTSPTAMPAAPTVHDAQIIVAGHSVQGLIVQGTNEPSLFRVRVDAPAGLATIERVVLRYYQPGRNHRRGPMMGGFGGTVLCYDDGTHGDDIPGDGIYYFMDPDEAIGCHGTEAPVGEYHYEFWCVDTFGQQSNMASVTVQRE